MDAALLQHLKAGGVTDAAEERNHKHILKRHIRLNFQDSRTSHSQMNQRVEKSSHHGSRNTVSAQKRDAVHKDFSDHEHKGRNCCCLIHVKRNNTHNLYLRKIF